MLTARLPFSGVEGFHHCLRTGRVQEVTWTIRAIRVDAEDNPAGFSLLQGNLQPVGCPVTQALHPDAVLLHFTQPQVTDIPLAPVQCPDDVQDGLQFIQIVQLGQQFGKKRLGDGREAHFAGGKTREYTLVCHGVTLPFQLGGVLKFCQLWHKDYLDARVGGTVTVFRHNQFRHILPCGGFFERIGSVDEDHNIGILLQ